MENKMFCFQCQETAGCTGCKVSGVCGKTPQVAHAQDLLIYVLKGLGVIANHHQHSCGHDYCDFRKSVHAFVNDALFCTITNANFDPESIYARIEKGLEIRDTFKYRVTNKKGIELPKLDVLDWHCAREQYDEKAQNVGILAESNEDIRSLKELTMYGLKGMAAYLEHAARLGQADDDANEFILQTLGQLVTCNDTDELTALTLKTGEWGVKAMALLDKANTTAYGNPEITEVNIGVGNRLGILISGHDLNDIEQLLEQSKDAGIDIYTHSEMLPAHYYPRLKQYSHLKGNYGNAWWKQREEFEAFNGPILFTTNCIVPPIANATYKERVFTTNSTGFPGWKHIPVDANGKKDFSEIIALAKTCPAPKEIETGKIVGGFAHEQVFALADKVVEAVKSGAIRKFVVMAGCDGRMKSREYYTEFAKALPKDCVILTAGCAKYKYNKLALGDIGGIPRVLDAGQCNDSYSLALIALKLKEVFGLDDVNQLPIAYNIAWYEQKAVIVLLALLSLGVKNIHLGPTLPAFLSPNVAKVLVENFGIGGISTVEEDLKLLIGE
ncbi:MAG: hydroxylamine reductase [Bacteroidales bacterium]|nr:hydroxylamine reductase [Bacteroidales bacterium]